MKVLFAAVMLTAIASMGGSASAYTGAVVKAPENASVQRAYWDRGWHRGWYHRHHYWRRDGYYRDRWW